MGNEKCIEMFPTTKVVLQLEGKFDHSLMYIRCHEEVRRRAPFKYYKIWCQAPDYLSRVHMGGVIIHMVLLCFMWCII